MKKIIYIVLIIFLLLFSIYSKSNNLLPSNSLRFRIIANSNNSLDQKTKQLIKNDLENNLFKLLEKSTSPEETKKIIKNNEDVIKKTIEAYNVPYTINFGSNYFPEKKYKGITYKEGNYDSLVISLGEGEGNNWWCVMYPPLCLLDSKSEESEKVEYKSFFAEIINKLTS